MALNRSVYSQPVLGLGLAGVLAVCTAVVLPLTRAAFAGGQARLMLLLQLPWLAISVNSWAAQRHGNVYCWIYDP